MANETPAVAPASGESAAPEASEFRVSERYRSYVIWTLFAVNVFNFVDRQILTILIQPIKQEFGFSDTQMGLLGGLAFVALYSTFGMPIARWADRGNRVNIIAISLFFWSLFTAVTGMARNFTQMLLARVAVGIGEAGCTPPAYSLISDYFEPKRRATALSIYSMGVYGGIFVGLLAGGLIAQHYGWRTAFYVLGLPGVMLALVLKLTLREPPRGFSDAVNVVQEPPPVESVLSTLWSKRSFRHLSMAAALHSFVGYGVGGFNSAFLMRSHGMSVAEVGTSLALIVALGGLTGTYLGGWLADHYSTRKQDPRWHLWVPGISTLINVPFALLAYLLPGKYAVLGLMIPTIAIGAMYLGPTVAITQSLVGIRERALAGALLLFILNLIGLGLGPILTGILSDVFKGYLVRGGIVETAAVAEGLRWSLCAMVCVNVWSTFHYMRGARALREDLQTAATGP